MMCIEDKKKKFRHLNISQKEEKTKISNLIKHLQMAVMCCIIYYSQSDNELFLNICGYKSACSRIKVMDIK